MLEKEKLENEMENAIAQPLNYYEFERKNYLK